MPEKPQFKTQGLQFARSLQMLIKMVNIFSVTHKSAAGMLRRTYDTLNPLLKNVHYLTIGFVEQRILLNNILTAESSLKPLENEFLKRGIGAISFDAGITFAAFVKAIGAISTNPKTIQENGGLMPFLESQQLEFVRVFPAAKNEIRNEDGDTVLEMGSEEYLISKALSNVQSVPLQGIEGILTRMEGGQTGTGADEGTDVGTNVNGGLLGGYGSGGPATSGGGFHSAGLGGTNETVAKMSGLDQIQKLADEKFETSLRNPQDDPQKGYVELARVLSNLRPDGVLNNLSLPGGAAVGTAGNEEITAEIFEDSALRWALKRLAAVPTGGDAMIVEEQIFRVLMRSLQATHAASRLAQKLADFAKDYVLPKQTLDRLQQELRWLTLTSHGKLRELLGVEHFSPAEFRRALDLIKDLIRMGSPEGAEALGHQYLSIFEDHESIRIEEVGRIPELLRALAGVQGEFWLNAEERLLGALANSKLNRLIHMQLANASVALGRIAATYENFAMVRRIGAGFERIASSEPATHNVCCRPAPPLMLQPVVVDRIAEMYLDRKHDSEWTRTVTALLRWADPGAIERVFVRLDTEPLAGSRLALMRLLGRVGPSGIAAARERLKRPEWYVVRNACKLLSELKDPEIVDQLLPVFAYPDERVQKAALHAVKKSSSPQRYVALARSLTTLLPALLEEALDELAFKPNADIIPFLGEFLNSSQPSPKTAMRIVQILSNISEPRSAELLAKLSLDERLEEPTRKAAREALGRRMADEENSTRRDRSVSNALK